MSKDMMNKSILFFGIIFFCGWIISMIFLIGCKEKSSIEKIEIPFKVTAKKNRYIHKGWEVWIKEGINGYKKKVMKYFVFNNKNILEKKIYESGILKKAKEGYLLLGTSNKKHPITVPKKTYVHYVHNVEATAYDPSPEANGVECAGITALGWRTRFGIAAVDPKVISMRSLIFVDGYGFAWTGDTGGDIKGKRIDLCYNTTKEALMWGRRKVKVYVLGKRPLSYYAEKRKK